MHASNADENLNPDIFRAVVKLAADAIIYADIEGVIRIWNDRAEKVFGLAAAEAVGRNLDIIIPEDMREAHWRGFHRAMATGRTVSESRHLVTPALHSSGKQLYVELGFSVVLDDAMRVVGAIAVARDVTRRVLAENAVLAEESKLHAAKSGWSWS